MEPVGPRSTKKPRTFVIIGSDEVQAALPLRLLPTIDHVPDGSVSVPIGAFCSPRAKLQFCNFKCGIEV
jgi:hypothetical protein